MDANSLIGVIGGILICMLGLLISMMLGLKKDTMAADKLLFEKVEAIQLRLTHMVLSEDYKSDKKEITLKLDDHGDRILTLEIRVKSQEEVGQ